MLEYAGGLLFAIYHHALNIQQNEKQFANEVKWKINFSFLPVASKCRNLKTKAVITTAFSSKADSYQLKNWGPC